MPATLSDASVGLVGLEDIEDGGRGVITIRSTEPREIQSLKTWFAPGDILYGKLRPYLNKVGIAPGAGLCSTEIWAFKASPLVDARYAAFFLASSFFVDRVASLTKGANLPRLDTDAFDSTDIPLPTLSEQQRIVDILQEADEIRRLRGKVEVKTTELILSLYRNTFLGERSGAPWKKIKVAEAARHTDNAIRTGPFGSDLRHSEFVDDGIPVLGIDNAVTNRFRWSERRYITTEKYADLTRYRVYPDDVIITIMGTVGRAAVAPSDLPEAISTKHLCVITPDTDKVLPVFLWATLLYNPSVRAQAKAAGKGAVMEGWNSKIIRSLRFELPPIDLQENFDEQVKEVLRIEDAQLAAFRDIKLVESLSAQAFSGQLTASWREAHSEELWNEARQRDSEFKQTHILLAGATALGATANAKLTVEASGLLFDLSREQMDLYGRISQGELEEDANRYFTAESLSRSLDGPLRRNPQAIEGHLSVLAARGLVIPLSLEERTEDTGAFVFGNAYRLPRREPALGDLEDQEAEQLGDQVGDQVRGRELERLVALLEQQRNE